MTLQLPALIAAHKAPAGIIGVSAVAGFVVLRRRKAAGGTSGTSSVSGSSNAGTAGGGGYSASTGAYDSTGSDVYNSVEPLIEALSQQIAGLQTPGASSGVGGSVAGLDALGNPISTSSGTGAGSSYTPPPPAAAAAPSPAAPPPPPATAAADPGTYGPLTGSYEPPAGTAAYDMLAAQKAQAAAQQQTNAQINARAHTAAKKPPAKKKK